MGNLDALGPGRDALKAALAAAYPDRKPGAIATWAGTLSRFRDEMQPGDVVVAPYKPDSTVNIGIVAGPYTYVPEAPTHRHRRPVTWKKVGISRTVFTQPALYELGAFLTVFGIRRHAAEFRAVLEATDDSVEGVTRLVEAVAERTSADTETTDEPRASRIERNTRDFVLETLHRRLSHAEFEEHHTGTVGAPEVQQLIGTQGPNELSLFVTLGAYSRDAVSIERTRSGLRLLTGEDVVTLVLQHYAPLPQRWRSRIPLSPVLVVDDAADA